MIEYNWRTFKVRTVWCIAHENAPASLRSLDETQFHRHRSEDMASGEQSEPHMREKKGLYVLKIPECDGLPANV